MTQTATRMARGAVIDKELGMATDTSPHRKIRSGAEVFYFTRFPEGDYAIHTWNYRDQNGYGGDVIRFLMEDGTYDEVKGPFDRKGLYDHGAAKRLAEAAGEPELALIGSRVAARPWPENGKRWGCDFDFGDAPFLTGDVRERVLPEWRGMQLIVQYRSGTMTCPASNYLQGEKA